MTQFNMADIRLERTIGSYLKNGSTLHHLQAERTLDRR